MKKYFSLGTCLVFILLAGAGCKKELASPPTTETAPITDSTPIQTTTQTPTPTPATTTVNNTTTQKNNSKPKPMDLSQYKTPIMLVDQNKTYIAKIKTTAGEMDISLNVKDTPVTANNFVFLAKKHFYDNVIFHRVLKGFMIQGGDPTGTGSGGPGYRFNDEPFTGEYTRGTIAMANSGANTNGSQFFIMHADYPLPPNYVIFGKLVSGTQTLDNIAEAPVTYNEMREKSKPIDPVKIISIEIEEK